jgi:hypothetical protein
MFFGWFRRRNSEVLQSFQAGLIVTKKGSPTGEAHLIHSVAYDPDTEQVLGAWAQVVNGKTHFSSVAAADYPKAKPSELRAHAIRTAVDEVMLESTPALREYSLRVATPTPRKR